MSYFIVFEGLDGSGKTTQIGLLAAYLESKGQKVSVSTEPTSFPSGKALREALAGRVPKTACEMAIMFTSDRIAHNRQIEAELKNAITVISDRYYYSSLAYQGSATDFDWVAHLNLDCPEIRRPDLTLFLDLTPEQSMERITKGRTPDELEIYENVEKLTRVRETFYRTFEYLKNERPEERIAVIDASGSIEEVHARILEATETAGLL